jgi:hypothetical protein
MANRPSQFRGSKSSLKKFKKGLTNTTEYGTINNVKNNKPNKRKRCMIMEKITNVKALEYVIDNGGDFPEEIVDKLIKIKESFEKKSSGNRKPTARQEENIQLQADIKEFVEGGDMGVTATEVLTAMVLSEKYSDLTLPRISAALTALHKANKIDRYMDKKKAYFKAVVA